ncbi:Cytochrome oxidase Cu insertion factor, SCO1/SenC/PrrC family [Albimonas donghaensis]|uniref:Cytochrome oxidase Cu insertion factor, SCO1/SenC/PrrC family n=1 Tax=Albimonas donghaensis TaxID=356660 RepID=A0A1H3AKS6_9RHOB|nr:SCO family protein [Albimonas donghaensis]SDX29774.1 Cytochrome oxidase Cu insertion factor, SCO1/SenC/PrrC family [Albimonas donghaensis]
MPFARPCPPPRRSGRAAIARAGRLALSLTLALAGAALSPALAASPRPAPPAEAPRFTAAEAAAQRDALRARGEASLAEARADLPADAPPPPAMAPDFLLTNQTGAPVGRDALAGRPWLLFFGYIVDQSLCSASLPRIAGAVNILEDAGVEVTPVIASIDPAQDRPGPMGPALARWHSRMEGLTGEAEALADLRRAFGVELEQVGVLPDGAPIWIHGGLLYLVGADGRVLAALPPLMEPRRLAEVVAHLL